jgi:RNA polymerase sigma factor for flagellar operon FliA
MSAAVQTAATATLWARLAAGDQSARDQLLNDNLGLVYHVARRMAPALRERATLDEMVSAGTLGLMDGVDAYDPARGWAFSSFATRRIRGAILDELRRTDHVSRTVRRKSRVLTRAWRELVSESGQSPSDAQLAERLGVDLETLWRWQHEVGAARAVPLAAPPRAAPRRPAPPRAASREPARSVLVESLAADEGDGGVEDRMDRARHAALLGQAILRLKEQERAVLSLYYFEELKLHEIGTVLNLTESRVCQIRKRALGKLRQDLSVTRQHAA